mmetsp:Transcript_42425/g.132295  ORF Transcript_42425/g.132295 Transcript_42425/m.132295 type:complete len:456 (+) Transcript_42425:473-1840(+)
MARRPARRATPERPVRLRAPGPPRAGGGPRRQAWPAGLPRLPGARGRLLLHRGAAPRLPLAGREGPLPERRHPREARRRRRRGARRERGLCRGLRRPGRVGGRGHARRHRRGWAAPPRQARARRGSARRRRPRRLRPPRRRPWGPPLGPGRPAGGPRRQGPRQGRGVGRPAARGQGQGPRAAGGAAAAGEEAGGAGRGRLPPLRREPRAQRGLAAAQGHVQGLPQRPLRRRGARRRGVLRDHRVPDPGRRHGGVHGVQRRPDRGHGHSAAPGPGRVPRAAGQQEAEDQRAGGLPRARRAPKGARGLRRPGGRRAAQGRRTVSQRPAGLRREPGLRDHLAEPEGPHAAGRERALLRRAEGPVREAEGLRHRGVHHRGGVRDRAGHAQRHRAREPRDLRTVGGGARRGAPALSSGPGAAARAGRRAGRHGRTVRTRASPAAGARSPEAPEAQWRTFG